jgi:hypothetical protein
MVRMASSLLCLSLPLSPSLLSLSLCLSSLPLSLSPSVSLTFLILIGRLSQLLKHRLPKLLGRRLPKPSPPVDRNPPSTDIDERNSQRATNAKQAETYLKKYVAEIVPAVFRKGSWGVRLVSELISEHDYIAPFTARTVREQMVRVVCCLTLVMQSISSLAVISDVEVSNSLSLSSVPHLPSFLPVPQSEKHLLLSLRREELFGRRPSLGPSL